MPRGGVTRATLEFLRFDQCKVPPLDIVRVPSSQISQGVDICVASDSRRVCEISRQRASDRVRICAASKLAAKPFNTNPDLFPSDFDDPPLLASFLC